VRAQASSAASAAARSGGQGRGAQRGQARRQILCRHGAQHARRRGALAWGGGEQGGGAALAPGAVQLGLRDGDAQRPIGAGGPAIIHHQEQRAGIGALATRAKHGAGQAQDQQGRGGDAHQQHPPGGAGGGFLGQRQVAQQHGGGEIHPARLGGCDAEQPPEEGQRWERQ
jgi:hypothetical protein